MRDISFKSIVEQLGSIRTALVLILALSAMAGAGTLLGPTLAKAPEVVRRFAYMVGISDTFRSPAFFATGALFAANVAVCTWRRGVKGSYLRNYRRRMLVWADVGMHLAIIVMILGGVGKAVFGMVGTGYLFPGIPTATMHDPVRGVDFPLGFDVVLRERRVEYYPLALKVGVREMTTDVKLGLLEMKGSESVGLPGTDLSLGIRGATDDEVVILAARSGGFEKTMRFSLKDGAAETDFIGRYLLSLVAYRRNVREVRGRIDIREDGRTVREAWLAVNGGVTHRGTKISLIAWSNDQSAEEFLGVQYRRDPTAPLFWFGTIVLCVLMPLFIVARRHRGTG